MEYFYDFRSYSEEELLDIARLWHRRLIYTSFDMPDGLDEKEFVSLIETIWPHLPIVLTKIDRTKVVAWFSFYNDQIPASEEGLKLMSFHTVHLLSEDDAAQLIQMKGILSETEKDARRHGVGDDVV